MRDLGLFTYRRRKRREEARLTFWDTTESFLQWRVMRSWRPSASDLLSDGRSAYGEEILPGVEVGWARSRRKSKP